MAIKSIEVEVECKVIPKLETTNSLTLAPGDTLVAHMGEDWDIEFAQELYKLLEHAFPNNNILVLPYGVDISVIKERNNKNGDYYLDAKGLKTLWEDMST